MIYKKLILRIFYKQVIKVSLIWSTVSVFLMGGWLFTKDKIFLIFLLIWIIRIILLKKHQILMQAVLILACFFIHFSNVITQIQRDGGEKTDVNLTLKVHPDELKVMDEGVSVRAYYNSINGKPVQAFIPINNNAVLSEIGRLDCDIKFSVTGSTGALDRPTNINQYDFRRFSYGKRIFFKIKKCQLKGYSLVRDNQIISKVHAWRRTLLVRCQELPNPLQSYCLGVIMGSQTDFFKENSSKLRDMGIIHLFCISGMHVFYLARFIERIAVFLRLKREDMEWIQIIILPVYFIIGGGSTSLFRAVTLVLTQLIAKKLNFKKQQALEVWCLVLLVNLFINPFVLLQMGGQLSYILSLVLIMSPSGGNLGMSIKVFLVEIPIILFSVYKIHIFTVLFNIIVVPIFSAIIIPILILSFTIPYLSLVFNPLINLFELLLEALDKIPGMIHFGKPPLWVTLILLVMALKIISSGPEYRKKVYRYVYCSSWILMWSYFKLIPFGEVTFFDVGQGDSILVREPFNRSVTLIDTGGKVQFGNKIHKPAKMIAENSSVSYLGSMGISKIDYLCLTHQDMDHIGEADVILKKFKVKNLIFPDGVETTSNYKNNIQPFIRNTRVNRVMANYKVEKFPMRILFPFQRGKGKNGDSLVLKGLFGKKQFLLTGDLDLEGEHTMLNRYRSETKDIDVFKLGHHGSKTANSDELLSVARPKLAIISAGRNNRYGHPNREVIERLKRLRIHSVSTQDRGMISYRFFPNGVGRWITGINEGENIVQ